ncbi:MAG: tetratricopeptide repeat protein [Acidimicrobiia bacterium]|nr:tetratricopeptide repeat protein [Acidimicrobiia bacterium]
MRILAAIAILAVGISTSHAVDDPDPLRAVTELAPVRTKIEAKDYKGAIALLATILKADPKNADAHNLMGYSLRKSGDFEQSLAHYQKALAIDPKHKGALEYLGELYVQTDQLAKAREMAARLKALCPKGCEELTDLEKAIAGAGRAQ